MTTLAAVSMHVEHDPKANLAEYSRYIREAAKVGVELITFPECSLQGFLWSWNEEKKAYLDDPEQRAYYERTAESIPGPSTLELTKFAQTHKMYIQAGLVERASVNRQQVFFNSAVLIGPKGILHVHRKTRGSPNAVFQYASAYGVYQTALGTVGSVICADLTFVETVRTLALKGAKIVVNSSAIQLRPTMEKANHDTRYELFCRAHAAFNHVWFVSSNQVGTGGRSRVHFSGHSLIVNPSGTVVADGGYNEGLVYAEVDLQAGFNEALSKAGRATPLTYRSTPGLVSGDGKTLGGKSK